MDFQQTGKLLLLLGVGIIVLGGLFLLLGKVPFLGNLPGDIRIQTRNFSCFVPLASMLLISIILTVVLNIVLRLLNR